MSKKKTNDESNLCTIPAGAVRFLLFPKWEPSGYWMADYKRIQSELELKLEKIPKVFAEGEPIILKPKLYLSGALVPKNDTLPEDISSNYEIRYAINRDLNIDSVYSNPDYAYFFTGLEEEIVLEDALPKGTHFVSINCQLNSDAGFSKQIKQQITVR